MPAARGVTIKEPDDRPSGAAGNTLGLTAEVDLLVLEYLAHAGYERATQNLKAELRERRGRVARCWRRRAEHFECLAFSFSWRTKRRGEWGSEHAFAPASRVGFGSARVAPQPRPRRATTER